MWNHRANPGSNAGSNYNSYAQKVRSILAKRQGSVKLGASGVMPKSGVVPKPKTQQVTSPSGDNTMTPTTSGEYILPKAYVDKVGGPDVLDQHVQQTLGSLQPPRGNLQKGYEEGGYRGSRLTPGGINDTFDLPTNFNFSFGDPNRGNFFNKWNDVPAYGDPKSLPPPPPQPPDPNVTVYNQNNPPPTPPNIQDEHPSSDNMGSAARSDTYFNRIGDIYGSNPYMMGTMPQGGAGYLPPQGLPGSGQGPVSIPSYFDPQGYPWAQPVTMPSDPYIQGLPGKKTA